MKKEVILVCLILFSLLTIQLIAGKYFTGLAISQNTNVSITILPVSGPTLTILSPRNQTYLFNHTLLLNYTAVNADSVWYHIDSSDNVTITSFIYFNTSQGSHTLYLYANNSEGTTTKNVNFNINLNMFTMNYSKFEGEYKGNSTNFYQYDFEELQEMENIIFEHISYGQIFFLEAINLTDDYNPNDGQIDIDKYINTSFNRIELNTSALPNFNRSATLRIYNLTFTNPRIAKDGIVCPSTICKKQSYSGGTLVFNVTHFTSYEAEETPSTARGGGGGGAELTTDFSIDETNIKIGLEQGQVKEKQVAIRNTGTNPLSVAIEPPKLKEMIKISQESFDLEAGEIKTLNLKVEAKEETTPDVYTDKILLKTAKIEKEILLTIEVQSGFPLFDVKIEIPENFLYIIPGGNVIIEGDLYNLGKVEQVDVTLEYTIKDFENNVIVKEQETKAIKKEIAFVKALKTPEEINYGMYNVYVKAIYNDKTAIASSWFSVSKKTLLKKEYIVFIIVSFIILTIMLYVLYEISRLRKRFKINEDILIKEKLIKLRMLKRR